MSKERELLQEVLDQSYFDKDTVMADIFNRITKLLAQPETEQEPVVWQYRTKPNWTGNWSKWEDYKKESYEDYVRFPEFHNWLYEVRELYTSPPKREPLSEDEVRDGLDGKNGFENWYDDRFVDGVRFAEKHHGIGGGE